MRSRSFALAALLLLQYGETITVTRYVVPVRVTDSRGNAVRDLRPEEFIVSMGGKKVVVEEAEWFGQDVDRQQVDDPAAPAPESEPQGRLVVFFMGSDFARNSARLEGQLKFNLLVDEILRRLGPHDRMAVVSHDSHLKLRSDFTYDRKIIRKAIADSILMQRVPLPPPLASGPSLARHLDSKEMLDAFKSESALLLVAKAMRRLEGDKVMVMASYGMGEKRGPRIDLHRDWNAAMALLSGMRVPVIALNTGMGGELSAGLLATAHATGGIYAFANGDFPQQSVVRAMGVLAGRYELVLRADVPLRPGPSTIDIRVTRRGLTVAGPDNILVDPEPQMLVVHENAQENVARDRFVEAMRKLQDGETEGVEAMLDEVIAMDETFAEAWYERGMLASSREDHAAAIRDLQRYLELEPRGRFAADAKAVLRGLRP